ncbi:MAG: tetratricopeptide repeat protein [Pseudomonadota bacterium]
MTLRRLSLALAPLALTGLLAACEPGSGAPDLFTANTGTAPGTSLGDRLAASGDLASAAAAYAQEAESAGNPLARARAYEKLGDVLLDADQPRQAIGAFREALAARPDLASAEEGLGVAFIRAGEPDAALPHLTAASSRGLPSAYSALGVAHDLLSQPEQALAAYDRGLVLDPGNLDLLTNKGISLALSGRHGEAYQTMRPAADSVFSTPRHRLNLVMVVAMSGRLDLAQQEGALMRLPPAEVSEAIALGQRVSSTGAGNRQDILTLLTRR